MIFMELFSIKDLPKEVKVKILKELGFDSDGNFVIDSNGTRIKDKYIGVDVSVSNMLIFPGSTIILDDNPLSVASYLEEHKDAF